MKNCYSLFDIGYLFFSRTPCIYDQGLSKQMQITNN